MAKDDYHVIAYRILIYLYACLKDGSEPDLSIISAEELKIVPAYWEYIIRHLLKDGCIEGVTLYNVVGRKEPMIKFTDLKITPVGIDYMESNSAMARARDFLKTIKDITPGL